MIDIQYRKSLSRFLLFYEYRRGGGARQQWGRGEKKNPQRAGYIIYCGKKYSL